MLPEISPLLPACDYPIENDTNGWERDGPLLDWRSKERSLKSYGSSTATRSNRGLGGKIRPSKVRNPLLLPQSINDNPECRQVLMTAWVIEEIAVEEGRPVIEQKH